jgi:hypothetical protein
MEVVQSIAASLDAGFRDLRFQEVESVIRAVRTWPREQETNWYREGMHALVSRWRRWRSCGKIKYVKETSSYTVPEFHTF